MISRDLDDQPPETTRNADAALQITRRPNWKPFRNYDRVVVDRTGDYPAWSGRGNGPWVHPIYMYVGGNGKEGGGSTGGIWWHGLVAYDGAIWNRYDDPFDFGPVPTLAHRRQHSKVAVLTDHMWVSEPANLYHPTARTT